jgi:hypothetical protein
MFFNAGCFDFLAADLEQTNRDGIRELVVEFFNACILFLHFSHDLSKLLL